MAFFACLVRTIVFEKIRESTVMTKGRGVLEFNESKKFLMDPGSSSFSTVQTKIKVVLAALVDKPAAAEYALSWMLLLRCEASSTRYDDLPIQGDWDNLCHWHSCKSIPQLVLAPN
jgi:hypothetical protein